MNEYLKNHIHEEIDGAIEYMSKALELKPIHPKYSAKFFKMAEMELEHANCMLNMFNEMNKDAGMSDATYSEIVKSIMNDYTTNMTKIENMKKLYYSK